MPRNLMQQFDSLRDNLWPAMAEVLAGDLGCTVDAIQQLGVGYYPAKQVWTFAERDATGKIVGLSFRTHNGKKFMHEGSKRGLIYPMSEVVGGRDPENYRPGKQNWIRVEQTGGVCPICGRSKYCLVSNENPDDPRAVLCTKIKEGSDATYHSEDAGWLHIRKPGGRVSSRSHTTLPVSDYPVLVVEGASDVLAALSLGLIAVGRPSAKSGNKLLVDLLRGRRAIIVGENDGGTGIEGMQTVYDVLLPTCKSVSMVLPPEHVKDLRHWILMDGIARDGVLQYAADNPFADPTFSQGAIFTDENPMTFCKSWLAKHYTVEGAITLRRHAQQWLAWNGKFYEKLEKDSVRGSVWAWAKCCRLLRVTAQTSTSAQYPCSYSKVTSIVDAANAFCQIQGDTPLWIEDVYGIDPKNCIAFKNGILDITTFTMHKHTPLFFSYNGLPYDYKHDADYSWWEDLVYDIMQGDDEKVRLLQQWFGYCMLPDTSQEKLMMFLGAPRSGKGTMLHALECILGPTQVSSTSLEALCGRFGFAPLVGKLAVLVGDCSLPRHVAPKAALEKILNITGQDGVTVDRKGVDAVEHVRLSCRFTLAANYAPAMDDHANALAPRMNLLEFSNSYIGREDKQLKRKVRSHAQSIATWSLLGLIDLREQGEFIEPASAQRKKDEIAQLNSPMRVFVEECCEVGDDYVVPWVTFRHAWRNWCEDHMVRNIPSQQVYQRIQMVERTVKLSHIPIADTKIKGLRGIRLTREAEETYT